MSQNLTESAAGPWTTTLSVPLDGEIITANADAVGDSPIVPAYQKLLNRDAQLVLGTVTYYSFTVDGVGEATVAPTAGLIGTTGNVLAQGLIQAGQQVEAGTEHYTGTAAGKIHMDQRGLIWDDVAQGNADGPNPPRTTSLLNQLRAVNTPKCWAIVRTTSVVGYFVDGCGFTAGSIDVVAGPVSKFVFQMAQAMTSTDYTIQPILTVVATGNFLGWSKIVRTSSTVFEVYANVDFSGTDYEITVHVYGRQAS